MKRTALTVMMTMAMSGSAAYAGHNVPAMGPTVTACLDNYLGPAYAIAPATTVSMFARIGVRLEWRNAAQCPSDALHIALSTDTPSDFLPGALAYAKPYEGIHIVVFLDRVKATVQAPHVPVVLAHVFAHEIAHILQGCSRHSDSGVMKALWTVTDYMDMAWQPLSFTPYDVELIRAGLANRSNSIAGTR